MVNYNPKNKQISLTRGDFFPFRCKAKNRDGTDYVFKAGDIVRFKVFSPETGEVVLQHDTVVSEENTFVDISITSEATTIGEVKNKPIDYWYEIKINPDGNQQTIIGYEVDKYNEPLPKIFKLLPEGSDIE